MNNLKAVLQQLRSEKVKERQEGVNSLRDAFARDSVVNLLDEAGDGRAWLAVFQALFTAVVNEKAACTKKTTKSTGPTATALKRLSEAASAVRWLTERSLHRLNKKVIKPLLIHVLQVMVNQGQLYAPVALDYTKTLRCVLGYIPHLEHLDDDTWVKTTEMAFNVVLGDSLRTDIEDHQGIDEGSSQSMDADSSVAEDEENDVLPSTSAATQSRKRRFREASGTPGPSGRRGTPVLPRARSVTLEQIEFTSMLVILLSSPSAPLLSPAYPNLASGVLNRLLRFIRLYPVDTSLHQDFLLTLSATLSHLSLNKRDAVTQFARGAWDGLLGMWGTKNRSMKEGLVVVLRMLFPFYTSIDPRIEGPDSEYNYSDGVAKLWHLLDGEADSRWGIDGLSLDSLKFQLASDLAPNGCELGAFIARTFRYGWDFDSGQALAWAILRLQADCAAKLFVSSESVHSPRRSYGKKDGKRIKLDDPISSLLDSIKVHATSSTRAYHLQILLFFIDQHWTLLYESLQQDILSTLSQFLSFDDAIIQSWTFLCFAAIAEREVSSTSQSPKSIGGPSTWDPIWTHAMRRTDVPVVSRAACHAAYTLLLNTKSILSSQRVLLEIETFAKNLDVQGPPFPYDSVCAFMALCLQVASQDMRLYRMHIEDKVLSWLTENWNLDATRAVGGGASGNAKTRISPPLVGDIIMLLEAICALPKRGNLVYRTILPECAIADELRDEQQTTTIRNFLLRAELPPFRPPDTSASKFSPALPASPPDTDRVDELVQPGNRERRISSSLLKFLETLTMSWEGSTDAALHMAADRVRRLLDIAVIAITFDSLLVFNGIRSNRRVVQTACKVVSYITPLLNNRRWTLEERALVLMGFEPLISTAVEYEDSAWEGLLPPNEGTGIRKEVLKTLTPSVEDESKQILTTRRRLQRVIWRSTDVQGTFAEVMTALRGVLKTVLTKLAGDPQSSNAKDVDDKDDFAPIRTTAIASNQPDAQKQAKGASCAQHIMAVCVSFLALAPILQSSSGEATRDRELTDIVLNSDGDEFLSIGPVYFASVREKALNMSLNTLDNLLDKFESLLKQYTYSKSERLQLLVVQFLDSTSHIWVENSVVNSEVEEHIHALCDWLLGAINNNLFPSWRVRDAIVSFLDRYIGQDPQEQAWAAPLEPDEIDDDSPLVPTRVLPSLSKDKDIRVRFRVASANARLFMIARLRQEDPLLLYGELRSHLCLFLSDYEGMLTRFMTLGNIMVHTSDYYQHIGCILDGVSARMGLSKPSELFEVYASQIAHSMHTAGADFLRLPPHLMGYRNRRECAEAAFRAFAPAVILMQEDQSMAERGKQSFVNHCKAIQVSPAEGFRDCFADIFGVDLVTSITGLRESGTLDIPKDLDQRMKSTNMGWDDKFDTEEALKGNMDGIVVAVLQALGDQDTSEDGPIFKALRALQSERVARAFEIITRYNHLQGLELYQPNLPLAETATILSAIHWLANHLPTVTSPAISYHVLHQMLAKIQQSPLVNEQIRSLNGLCLWISCNYRHFREPVLLQTLVNAAASLLAQIDLARGAQSMLEWAFGQYPKITHSDTGLPDVLIRICCLAHDYSVSDDASIAKLGMELLQWLEERVGLLATHNHIKPQIVKALPAWPREPSSAMASIFQDVTSHSLSAILADPRIESNRFRVVRRLRDLSLAGKYSGFQFSRLDFWRLKASIPGRSRLQDEDINAFATLLLSHKAQIRSFGTNPLSAQVVRQNRQAAHPKRSAKYAIVEYLLLLLDSDVPSRVHLAYHTLRRVASSDLPNVKDSSPNHAVELEYFRVCPQPISSRQAPSLQVLLSDDYINAAADFSVWVSQLTILLSDLLADSSSFYGQMEAILRADVPFAEEVLPILVHTLLCSDKPLDGPSHRSTLSNYFATVLSSPQSHVSSLRAIVNIVLHLRHFKRENSPDALDYDKWLDVDFILLSKSAIRCGMYTTALLFHELAANYCTDNAPLGPEAEEILFTIYSHIEEPDSFYGIRTNDFRQFLIQRFRHEQQWDKAFRFHGAALEADYKDVNETEGVLHSMHSFGFDHLAMGIHQTTSSSSGPATAADDMGYNLGWRTETWDLPDQTGVRSSGISLYRALRAVNRERDPRVIDSAIQSGLLEEMDQLRILGDEDLVGIHEVTSNLVCLNQVQLWRNGSVQRRLEAKQPDLQTWLPFNELDGDFEFPVLESIMATRLALLRSVRQKEQRQLIGTLQTPFVSALLDVEKRCLVRLSEAARESKNLQVALNSIVRARKIEQEPSAMVSQEFANVLWLQKEHKIAVQLLKDLISGQPNAKTGIEVLEKAKLLSRLGSWTSEACLEKPTDIWTSYFDPAATLLNDLFAAAGTSPEAAHAAVYHECAVFADRQYHAIIKSPDVVRWKVYVDRKTKEIQQRAQQLETMVNGSRQWQDLVRDQVKAKKLLKEDMDRYQTHNDSRNIFLQQAIDMYSRCLQVTDAFDDDAHIRLASLWFSNFDDADLQDKIRASIQRVPSRKFVFLAHQLSARLSKSQTDSLSQETLQTLILRMCSEHPFHSLYQVYCLRLMTEASVAGRRTSSRHDPGATSQGDRTAAANDIFDRLRLGSSAGRLADVERVCEVSLQWAKFPIKKDFEKLRGSGPWQLPPGIKPHLDSLSNIHVPVITVHTPIDSTMQYQNCVWIAKYKSHFQTAGGVNLPKISYCVGSDGLTYKQLFKGEGDDDLRQDAVMEQVFDLVDIVLRRDRETRKRNLSIRGYKVIPLSAQAGVLEFVENTSPLSSWIGPAHRTYRPRDLPAQEFGKLSDLRKTKKADPELPAKLLKLYLELKQRYRPVMRHYFTEKHKMPMSWFAMRLNYTRSVATTSIVGHILGLGDRHTSNILIDNSTGEVVHIDLGIAFEQGKLLTVPECVPFRMTADMVDGMGTAGTQGVFQRCAEETLRVLRDGSEIILTVLEVFKHDPLHSWTASEMKMKRAQGSASDAVQPSHELARIGGIGIDMSSGGVDEAADRALTSVARKLDRALSVEYTVNELIAEATDPANLACMFMGWSPFQ
ncbi:hypothetical protein EVG20_g7665 [Dentipellis fragilis]|uniref:Serine/threonine-protein kinase Tel1 n=1 Tax=Dentipellis fragilis TaxID=205917 RepID=A0A4Y9YE97_9AGAM|nr:hypothetical protein EVG20_g7665 [Dentipellis fragilis]